MEQAEALSAYRDYVKKNPQHQEAAREDFYKTFGVDPEAKRPLFSGSTGEVAKKARVRYAQSLTEGGAETYAQDIANARAKFVGDVSKAIPVAATLATGGLAAPVAMGVMGLAGGAAGAYEETAKLVLGATDTSGYEGLFGTGAKKTPTAADRPADSPAQLARRLGVDSALSLTTEFGGRLMGKLLETAGRKVWEPMVARAAEKTDKGQTILGIYGGKLLNKIRGMDAAAGTPRVSIQPELNDLEASLALRRTGPSDAFKEFWGRTRGGPPALSPGSPGSGMAQKIADWDGSISGLVEIKGSLSQAAFKRSGLNHEEQTALRAFAEKIDKKLTAKISEIGGEEGRALYNGYKETILQLRRFSAGLELAEQGVKRFAYRTAYGYALSGGIGAAGGAGYGGRHGSIAGAAEGALIGAAAGTAFKTLEQRAAPAILEHMLADKVAAPLTRQAINAMANGDAKAARSIFARAMAQAGVKDLFGSAMKQMAEEDAARQPKQEVPNAAPQR